MKKKKVNLDNFKKYIKKADKEMKEEAVCVLVKQYREVTESKNDMLLPLTQIINNENYLEMLLEMPVAVDNIYDLAVTHFINVFPEDIPMYVKHLTNTESLSFLIDQVEEAKIVYSSGIPDDLLQIASNNQVWYGNHRKMATLEESKMHVRLQKKYERRRNVNKKSK